jgi:hypothetical protein
MNFGRTQIIAIKSSILFIAVLLAQLIMNGIHFCTRVTCGVTLSDLAFSSQILIHICERATIGPMICRNKEHMMIEIRPLILVRETHTWAKKCHTCGIHSNKIKKLLLTRGRTL